MHTIMMRSAYPGGNSLRSLQSRDLLRIFWGSPDDLLRISWGSPEDRLTMKFRENGEELTSWGRLLPSRWRANLIYRQSLGLRWPIVYCCYIVQELFFGLGCDRSECEGVETENDMEGMRCEKWLDQKRRCAYCLLRPMKNSSTQHCWKPFINTFIIS